MRKRTKFILLLVTVLNVALFSITAYASGWLLKINNKTVITMSEFNEEYNASVELQIMNLPLMPENDIKEMMNSKELKKNFLKQLINEHIVIREAKKRKIFDDEAIERKLDILRKIFKRKLIWSEYIRKVISKKATANQAVMNDVYNKLLKDERTKHLSAIKKRDLAKLQARRQDLKVKLAQKVDELKSNQRVKISDDFDY
ncbi:MAG: SurA N-terminal domain-containing protein [Spirochaetota bacterium]|nr:SurA N-terminal domain-containing protein [Spirochaetota bacterium]